MFAAIGPFLALLGPVLTLEDDEEAPVGETAVKRKGRGIGRRRQERHTGTEERARKRRRKDPASHVST